MMPGCTNACECDAPASRDRVTGPRHSGGGWRINEPMTAARPRLTLLAFGGSHCAPCRALAPVLARLAEVYAAHVEVRHVDAHEDGALTERFHVRAVPTLIVLEGERVIVQQVGYAGAPRVEQLFEDLARR